MSGNRNAHTKLLFVSIGLMMLMNGSCSRSSRLSTCAEIRSAAVNAGRKVQRGAG